MSRSLTLHPHSRCAAVIGLEADALRPAPGTLELRFVLAGLMTALVLPDEKHGAHATRADGLWRHTCFEAFLRTGEGPGYIEFNLAPSLQWAAYAFDAPRSGMRPAENVSLSMLEVRHSTGSFELRAAFAGLPPGSWRLGLSAVIETADGLSYWALKHPPGRPDFHHSDCFALELA